MKELSVIQKIELRIKKDENSDQLFKLASCDYSFSTYFTDEVEKNKLEVNLSCAISGGIDNFFLEWLSNQAGEWSGSLKIFYQDQEKAKMSFVFEHSLIHNFSQSFYVNNEHAQDGYFSGSLRGVVLNGIKMN